MSVSRTAVAIAFLSGCAMETAVAHPAALVDATDAVTEDLARSGVGSVVALMEIQPGGSTRTVCTGALITPHVVLTAAHCVAGIDTIDRWFITAGVLDSEASDAPRYPIASLRAHPGFPATPSADPTSLGRDEDIATIRLSDLIPSPTVPVLPASDLDAVRAVGQPITLVGYGAASGDRTGVGRLRYGETTIARFSEAELLAGEGASTDTCFADSGGPAFVTLDGTTYLLGITSRASRTSSERCGGGTIFTMAPAYETFIAGAVSAGCHAAPRTPTSPGALAALGILIGCARARPR